MVSYRDQVGRVVQLTEETITLEFTHGAVSDAPHIFGGHSVQLCVKGKWCGKPVQYLHDLQNMHLDLTGEELSTD
jgi:hypothetical protein